MFDFSLQHLGTLYPLPGESAKAFAERVDGFPDRHGPTVFLAFYDNGDRLRIVDDHIWSASQRADIRKATRVEVYELVRGNGNPIG